MAYKGWKMMEKIDVAVKTSPSERRTFSGYVVEHGDKNALEKAKDWAKEREYDYEKKEYVKTWEPAVYTFDNEGFTVKILKSAYGSSQGGRVSFLACEVEKDDIKFVIGVNDELLVDLIRNSEISKGVIKEKVIFVRNGGQPGFIHEKMDAYKDAMADMKQKADLKKAKKTKKWEIGGVYSTLTQADVCIGEVFDTLEEYQEEESYNSGWRYGGRRTVTKFRKRETPVKTLAWVSLEVKSDGSYPDDLGHLLETKVNHNYIYCSTGEPPARSKAHQLIVKESDFELIDRILAEKTEYVGYSSDSRPRGRYVREIK